MKLGLKFRDGLAMEVTMKKILLIFISLLLSFNLYAHCGSCGAGGEASDHSEGEDIEHHENDEQFKKNADRRDEMEEEDTEAESGHEVDY